MASSDAVPEPLQLYRLPTRERTLKTDHADNCVIALKALGEETRVRIVGLLIERPLDVSEISERVGVSQYNVSKHLRILREAGLLEMEKSGRRRLYALPDAVRERAAQQRVLDLGCCSFTFERPAAKSRSPRAPRR